MTATVVQLTAEHLWMVLVSTLVAVLAGVPLGIAAARRERVGRVILAVAGGLQVVPSLALFGLLLPLPVVGGIGTRSAVVALVLYALLPIVRATAAGLAGIDPAIREAARAMGMSSRQRLLQVELPLALGVIASGVRVATVIGVGVATIAAAIGAGGLGTLIFRGLRMNDDRLVLAGALPAAAIALTLDVALGWLASRLADTRPPGRRGMMAMVGGLAALVMMLFAGGPSTGGRITDRPSVTLCCKDFTEQVVLGEILAQALEARGVEVIRRFELGGTLCDEALRAGRVDAYPEYTGTAFTALLHHAPLTDPAAVWSQTRAEYAQRFGVVVSAPLGFANDFAILVRGTEARIRGLRTVSDLAAIAPTLRAGFGQDFVSRPDGYAGFVAAYGLRFREAPREMDLALTYRALAAGEVDVIAGNSTDGLIDTLGLVALEDDRRYFPPYEAVWLARHEAVARMPALGEEIAALAGRLSTATMRRLNHACDGEHRVPAAVAAEWLAAQRGER